MTLLFTPQSVRDLEALDQTARNRMLGVIDGLTQEPTPQDADLLDTRTRPDEPPVEYYALAPSIGGVKRCLLLYGVQPGLDRVIVSRILPYDSALAMAEDRV